MIWFKISWLYVTKNTKLKIIDFIKKLIKFNRLKIQTVKPL